MKINVGSQNPMKIEAVGEAFGLFFKDINIKGIDVDSRVSHQPKNLKEIIQGARNRAIDCFKDCDYGVGLEGGIFKVDNSTTRYMNVTCCVIYDGKRMVGLGLSPGFEYPGFIINRIFKNGLEIGEIFDELVGDKNIKQKQGAVGILSHDQYSRKELTKAGVIMALFPIINKEYYTRK